MGGGSGCDGYTSEAGMTREGRRGFMHSQSASPMVLNRTSQQQKQQQLDYQSDSTYGGGQLHNQGYKSETGYRRSQYHRENSGYSSDNVNVGSQPSISPPPPSAVVQPQGVRRDDSGRSIMSALTVDDDIPSVVNVADVAEEEDQYGNYREDVESFYNGADLWHVYESEGYPYYLR